MADPPYDPNNPATWTGDQRVQYLGGLGLQWVGGSGDNAVWQQPNGARISEKAALENTLGTYSAATAVAPGAPTTGSFDTTAQIGLNPGTGQYAYFTVGRDGQPIWGAQAPPQNMHPGSSNSSSYNVSQQLVDPQTLALQQAQLDETTRVNTATIQRNAQQDALAAQQQQFLQQKADLAQKNDDARLANETNAQIASVQQNRAQLALQTQQAQFTQAQAQKQYDLTVAQFNAQAQQSAQAANATNQQSAEQFNAQQAQQVNLANASGQTDVAKFNAQQQLATEQANAQAAQQKRQDLANVNTQIGTLGQDTGNRGRFAAFVAANRGWGQDNTAVGNGASLIDQQSLGPLESQLGIQKQIQGQSENPYQYTPVQFTGAAAPTPINFTPQAAALLNMPAEGPLAQAGPVPQAPAVSGGTAAPATPGVQFNPQASAAVQAYQQSLGANNVGTQLMSNGGMVQGAFMSGDSPDGKENPEIVIPMGDGSMVVSLKGMSDDRIREIKGRIAKFATGGLFGNVDPTQDPLSSQFLQQASDQFRQGTPWQGQQGALPSPVYQSSPGFNPQLGSLLNSGRALEQGIPTDYSSWLASRYTPNAISDRVPIFRSVVSRSQ